MNWSRTMHIGDADAVELEVEASPNRALATKAATDAANAAKPKSKVMPMLLIGAAVIGVFYFMKRRSS